MTAPISFPGISSPQFIPRRQQDDGLAELMLGIMQHREQVSLQRENLALEKERTTESVASSKQDRQAKKRDMEIKEQRLEAAQIVAEALPGLATAPGDRAKLTEEMRVKLIQSNKKIAPFVNEEFNIQVKNLEDSRTAIAQRRLVESDATVSEATADPRIRGAKATATKAESDARKQLATETANIREANFRAQTTQYESAIRAAEAELPASRLALFNQYMQGSANTAPSNAGDAARLSGISPEKLAKMGLAPDFKLDATMSGAGQTRQAEASGQLELFRSGRQQIEVAGMVPLKVIGTLRANLGGKGISGSAAEVLGNMMSSDKQNLLITGYRSQAAATRYFLSGKASGINEEKILMLMFSPVAGDGPMTILGKTKLANAMEEAMARVANRELSPTAGVDYLLKVARANKVGNETLKAMGLLYSAAAKFEKSDEYKERQGLATSEDVDSSVAKFYQKAK